MEPRECFDDLLFRKLLLATTLDKQSKTIPSTTILICFQITCTSSTARGGGGSFETTKTIGEIGCCESRMSEQKH